MSDDTTDQPQSQPLSARRQALTKMVQEWLDKFADESFNVNYGTALLSVYAQAQAIYLRMLIDTGVVDEEEAVCKQLEIQTIILEDQFKAALLARDEEADRRALAAGQAAGRIQPVRGPRLIVPGGRQRDLGRN